MRRYLAVLAALTAAAGIAYAAAPSSAPATTGPAFIAFGYDDDGNGSVVRSSGVTSVDVSPIGQPFFCVSLDWSPTTVSTSDATRVFLNGDLTLSTTLQDEWFGVDGYCPDASAAIQLIGDPVAYVTFE